MPLFCRFVFLLAVGGLWPAESHAGAIRFDGSRDALGTITPQVNPRGTVLGGQATTEAWVLFTNDQNRFGDVYNEWALAFEDKHFRLGPNMVQALYAGVSPGDFTVALSLSLNQWHHIAHVYDGTSESIFLDGARLASRPASGDILDYPRNDNPSFNEGYAGFGAYFRDSRITSSFTGILESFRISSIARYSGTSYSRPSFGDFIFDGNTSLLFNFQEPSSSLTVSGVGPGGFTARLGTIQGSGGGTPPELIFTPDAPIAPVIPEPSAYMMSLIGAICALALYLKHSRQFNVVETMNLHLAHDRVRQANPLILGADGK